MSNQTVDLGVVVLSSDGYQDVWPLFCRYWFENSPFCSLPIYLITATKGFADSRVCVVNTPEQRDSAWADRMIAGLNRVPHEYILVLTEDLICFQKTPVERAMAALEFIQHKSVSCLRLQPKPPPNYPLNREIGVIADWALHRVSLQAAIWRRSVFLELLREGESPWQFELLGSRRSSGIEGFYSFKRSALFYKEIVGRGKINRRAWRRMEQDGVAWACGREAFSRWEQLARDCSTWRGALFNRFPSALQHALISRKIVGSSADEKQGMANG